MKRRVLGVGVMALAAALAGCKDLVTSLTDRAHLSAALASSGALGNAAAAYGAYGVLLVTPGSLGPAAAPPAQGLSADLTGITATTYEGAIGVQVLYTSGASHSTFTGVIGWTGFNSAASTVDAVVLAGAPTGTSTPQTPGGFPINDTLAVGSYWTRVPVGSFAADSGLFTLTNETFGGGATDCTSALANAGVVVSSCSYQTGTLTGSFHFGSVGVSGGSAATYVQPAVAFTSLASVQITIVK